VNITFKFEIRKRNPTNRWRKNRGLKSWVGFRGIPDKIINDGLNGFDKVRRRRTNRYIVPKFRE